MISKHILEDLYVEKDMSIAEVSTAIGKSPTTVSRYLKQYGIKIKGIGHYNIKPEIVFTQRQYEFFDSLMISDGSLVAAKSEGCPIAPNLLISPNKI